MFGLWSPEKGEYAIIRLSDQAFISIDESNYDYRQYLAWCDEGNVAEPWTPEEPIIEEVTAEEPVIEDAN